VRHLPARTISPSRTLATLLAALLLVLSSAAPASAGSTRKILEACSEGRVPRGYSQQAYRQALKQMPSELSEYSDCPSLIHKAQLADASGGGGGSGLGGGAGGAGSGAAVAPPTQAEQRALESSTHSGGAPVSVGGEAIHPGVVHVDIASALSSLPTPLLALLAFLLVCTLLLGGWALRNRVGILHLGRGGADRGGT
jgi:hypothetical protein